jgi:hypothetical protein
MKHFASMGALVAAAFIFRCALFRDAGFDIYVHASYRIVSPGIGIFWFLMGIVLVWFLTLASRKLFGARNIPS